VIDLLLDGQHVFEFAGPRVETRNTHGTGCTFSSAIAASLALGVPLPSAVEQAKAFVDGAMRHGLPIGKGHGPLNHFWRASVAGW
jgi:hydroxymethylpyrimidine/phosphomethylpyrimidine kinase